MIAEPEPRNEGGTAPWPSWPSYELDEIDAVASILRSGRVNYWTGDEGRKFEQEYAAHADCKYGIALANGTVALELALYALNIGVGDEVVVPSRTFLATASCAVMRGATPVMADVDPVTQTLTLESIQAVVTPRTKAIIVVHLAGWPCDMQPVVEFAGERGIKVIEDCAQANGARYKGRAVGSFGDAAAFSFCQDKIITTGGEGGMLTTNDEEIWQLAWSFKDHGKSFDAVYNRQHPPGFRWLHESFGTNFRMTEMQSAIGRIQLRKLDAWSKKRREYADILNRSFAKVPALRVTIPPPEVEHAYYKYYAFVRPERLRTGWTRDRIVEAVIAEGVPCFSGSCSEIYLEKAFETVSRPAKRLKVAQELGETSLMFLVHPTLSRSDINDCVAAVGKVMNNASWKEGLSPGQSRHHGASSAG
jgi:dTDP-4-amino-4,6-dideoxygalactose transaminase